MDPDIGRWTMEFLLRNPNSVEGTETLIKKLLRLNPPLDFDSRLKKTVLLRSLQDDLSNSTITEIMLEKLEILEELYRCEGSSVNSVMSAAYCAVAVHCTLKHLAPNNPVYLNAIERIWRGRVIHMEPSDSCSGSLMFSQELSQWRSDIEASLVDSQVMERLANINTKRDAIQKLKGFLDQAWENLGPLLDLPSVVQSEGTETCTAHSLDDAHESGGSPLEIQVEDPRLEGKFNPTSSKEVDPSTTFSNIESVPIHETRKLPESLICGNSLGLHTLVKDPPTTLRAESSAKDMNTEPPIENQIANEDLPDPPVCPNINNDDNLKQSDVRGPSMMDRNDTACTHEWKDSIDDLETGTSNHASRFHLPSPRRKETSPLKYKPENLTRRRKPRKWSLLEEEKLTSAVKEFGEGNWKLILENHKDTFLERTAVDLKDKWRNLKRYGTV